jgi:hypothetical protein
MPGVPEARQFGARNLVNGTDGTLGTLGTRLNQTHGTHGTHGSAEPERRHERDVNSPESQ